MVLELPPQADEDPDAPVAGVEPEFRQLLVHLLAVAAGEVVVPVAEPLGQAVDLGLRAAQRLGRLARGHPVAVGDHVRGHRRAVPAVAPVDVLDHLLALVAGRQVEVDVRPLAAFLGQEALEQQVHLHRIDRGDRQGVADGGVGGRAAALGEDPLLLAEADDVPDDQEVAGEVELLDQREFLLELRPGPGGQRPEALPRPLPGQFAEMGDRRFAVGHRVVREAVAEVGEGEVEFPGQFVRGVDGPGEIGEHAVHLLRRPQAALALASEAGAGVIDRHVVPDRGHQVVEGLVGGRGVTHAARGDDRHPEPVRQPDQGLVAVFLGPDAVARDLHVQAAGENGVQPFELAPGRFQPLPRQRPSDRVGFGAGQAVEACRVLLEQRPVDPRLALGVVERAGGQQAAEVAVALPASHEQVDAGLLVVQRWPFLALPRGRGCLRTVDHRLGADQGPDSRLLRCLVEARRAGDAVAVEQGDSRQSQRRRPRHQVLGLRRAAQEGERRRGVEFGVGRGRSAAALRRSPEPSPAELLLDRARRGVAGVRLAASVEQVVAAAVAVAAALAHGTGEPHVAGRHVDLGSGGIVSGHPSSVNQAVTEGKIVETHLPALWQHGK